jgi:hypothetical protein
MTCSDTHTLVSYLSLAFPPTRRLTQLLVVRKRADIHATSDGVLPTASGYLPSQYIERTSDTISVSTICTPEVFRLGRLLTSDALVTDVRYTCPSPGPPGRALNGFTQTPSLDHSLVHGPYNSSSASRTIQSKILDISSCASSQPNLSLPFVNPPHHQRNNDDEPSKKQEVRYVFLCC